MPDASPAAARPRRDRARTEAALRDAVEQLLIEGGFAGLTPMAVARRAGVDKMLIYRYFGGLPGLIRAIAFAPDFFPSFAELCGPEGAEGLCALPFGERASRILTRNVEALIARPAVLELMVWELVERNELTAIMEEARETLGLQILEEVFADVRDRAALMAMSAVLSAGVTYLALRRRKIRWYSGVDLRSDEGWAQIARAITQMAQALDTP